MGFIMHFYIIFGTNLLTEGLVQIVFFLFQCFAEKEYQTEPKCNETFARIFFWNKRNPGDLEYTSGKLRGGHEAGRRAPTLVAPLTDFFRLYISIYTKNIEHHNRSGIRPPQASVATKN